MSALTDWQQRMIEEREALRVKALRLREKFNDEFEERPLFNGGMNGIDHDGALLLAQYNAMMAYLLILELRISRFEAKP